MTKARHNKQVKYLNVGDGSLRGYGWCRRL